MKFTLREIGILKRLSNDKYVTSQQLSFLVNVSIRTIKNDIKSLKEKLNTKHEILQSMSGKGYRINETYEDELSIILSQQPHNKFLSNQSLLGTRTQRVRFLMKLLVMENQSPTLSELSNLMYLSESSTRKDILTFKDLLEQYQLELEVSKEKRMLVVGDEMDVRNVLFDYFDQGYYEAKTNLKLDDLVSSIHQLLVESNHAIYSDYAIEAIAKNTMIMKHREDNEFSLRYSINEYDEVTKRLTQRYLKQSALLSFKYFDYIYMNFLTKKIYLRFNHFQGF